MALGTVGFILMAAGAVGLLLALLMNNPCSHTHVEQRRIRE